MVVVIAGAFVSEVSLHGKVVVALEASQASRDGVEVSSSRSLHGLGFTSLRVESLGIRRLAQPSLHSGGRTWGFPDQCLSSLPPTWYPHILDTFHFLSTETILQSPYHDHLFVYVDALKG